MIDTEEGSATKGLAERKGGGGRWGDVTTVTSSVTSRDGSEF